MNHAAVRSVSMRNLNRQRANIVLSNLIDNDKVLAPHDVSQHERIFEWDGVLRWKSSIVEGRAYIGVPVQKLMGKVVQAHQTTGAIRDADLHLQRIFELFRDEDYLFWCDEPQRTGYIVLKESASAKAQLKAWALALWVVHRLQDSQHATSVKSETNDSTVEVMHRTLHELTERWNDWVQRLEAAGWDIHVASLETLSGTRIHTSADQAEDNASS